MIPPRIIAFYLPQFHPIPENDEWWGRGFTEWTNVGKAKKLFPFHYQPKIPADLGYYDLRVPEIREEQANLAREGGIEGFCYWHYWFGNGKTLLEKPFSEVLRAGKPDFPFCLAWANESWYKKTWTSNGKNKLLIEQIYGGNEDYIKHFYSVLPAFKDKRYIKIDDKPVFVIYKPLASPEIKVFIKVWRELAKKENLNDIYFVGHCNNDENRLSEYKKLDIDCINILNVTGYTKKTFIGFRVLSKLLRVLFSFPHLVSYETIINNMNSSNMYNENIAPTILSGWDHTPRSGKNGFVMTHYTPKKFRKHVDDVLSIIKGKNNKLVFLKSWNEWGEGNFLEPEIKYGTKFLKELHSAVLDYMVSCRD